MKKDIIAHLKDLTRDSDPWSKESSKIALGFLWANHGMYYIYYISIYC
jgi:hypothetical protein